MMELKYYFDASGTLAENYMVDEPHAVTTNGNPVVLVTNGMFYTKDFIARYEDDAVPLTAGTDFTFVGQDTYITAKTGLENASAIQLTNPRTGNLLITHRLVGGKEGMLNVFVDYLVQAIEKAKERNYTFKEIKNRPALYPPEQHTHVLQDLQKWEALNTLLLQIRDAIIDTRSLGSSAIGLANQDQRILKLIADMQRDISALSLRIQSLLARIEEFQRFSMDGGTLSKGVPAFPNVATMVIESIDLNDPYNKVDRDLLLTPSLLHPLPGSRGVSRSPLLIGTRTYNGHGKIDKQPFLVHWVLSDFTGRSILQRRIDYEAGAAPALDLEDENLELVLGATYRLTMHYELSDGTRISSKNMQFIVTESRLENVSMDITATIDEAKYGEDLSFSRDGLIMAVGVKTFDGTTKPSLMFFNGRIWTRVMLPLPSSQNATGIASRVLVDPQGRWVLLGGKGQNFIRRYPLVSSYQNGYPTMVAVGEPSAIQMPSNSESWANGVNFTTDRLGEVLVVATTGNRGSFHFYDIIGDKPSHLYSYNNIDPNLPIAYGGLGKSLAMSDHGNMLVVSSPFTVTQSDGKQTGSALVFKRSGNTWLPGDLFIEPTAGNGSLWGNHISMDRYGDYLYVSEQLYTDPEENIEYAGRGLYYRINQLDQTLELIEDLRAFEPRPNLEFGAGAIDSEGKTLAAAGNTLNGMPGVQFYRRISSRWVARNVVSDFTSEVLPHKIELAQNGSALAISSTNLRLWSGDAGDSTLLILR